jgi:hypothetical protein
MNAGDTGRRHNMKYKFVSNFEEPKAIPEKIVEYYQICAFKDKDTGLYQVRKFTINGNNEFTEIKIMKLNKKDLKKLLATKKQNEYRIYSVYDVQMITYPTLSDVLELKSQMITGLYDDYGFAAF